MLMAANDKLSINTEFRYVDLVLRPFKMSVLYAQIIAIDIDIGTL